MLTTAPTTRSILLAVAGLALGSLPSFAADCQSLASLYLPHTTITAAEDVTTGKFEPAVGKPFTNLPPFCRVAATLAPSSDSEIRVEIWMPKSSWNHRLEGTGNGGFAGNISYQALAEGVQRGFAVANTDMGMATPPGATAGIFVNRPQRWIDWGYRATHEMTVVAKQVVQAYYTQDPSHTYFVGCSTGGEQALMESQRYPDDYDGIVGGAPANNRTGVHVSILWNFAANERTPASYLPAAARSLLSQAVMNACDALDGVKDGIITDPEKCHFNPASLQCKGANQQSCLTAPQVETAKRLYAGTVNPRTGQNLYPGLSRGSEFAWDGIDRTPGPTAIPPYAAIFQWVFGLNWNWRQFDFDHNYTLFNQKLAGMVNATSPDIDTFRAHGHKLLIYHGWSDWLVPPEESIIYYNSLLTRDKISRSGTGALDQSVRLFMVPGMSHCSGGPGATRFDVLGAIVDWVEHGTAPDKIIATGTAGNLQRPLCSYPRNAQYKGSGSTNDASNFVCAAK